MTHKLVGSAWHLMFIVLLGLFIVPLIFMSTNAFKTLSESYDTMLQIIPSHPTLTNFRELFSSLPVWQIMGNTFMMAGIVALAKLLTSFIAGYVFATMTFKGKRLIYFVFMATIFVPFTMVMIPNYLVIAHLGLLNQLLGVVLPQLCDATGILLLYKAIGGVSPSMLEVARLDNVSDGRLLSQIIFPMVRPQVVSIGVIFFINAWNEYVWPTLILKDKAQFTLPIALQTYISSEGGTEFPIAMALSVLMTIPPLLLYLIFQRYILNAFGASGLK